MHTCTVTRTHRHGRRLAGNERDEPVAGPVGLVSVWHDGLHRSINCLQVTRRAHGGRDAPSPIPPLWQPELLAWGMYGMMLAGFEEIGGQRYYQGWYIRWE